MLMNNYVLLTFDTQSVLDLKSRFILATQHPCHSERSAAPLPPVILNEAQRSEESKLIAHPPFTDLRFLPSLETTRPKFCHPERSIPSLPSRTPPILSFQTQHPFPPISNAPLSCHSGRSPSSPAIPTAAPLPTAQILPSRTQPPPSPCHSGRNAAPSSLSF